MCKLPNVRKKVKLLLGKKRVRPESYSTILFSHLFSSDHSVIRKIHHKWEIGKGYHRVLEVLTTLYIKTGLEKPLYKFPLD